MESVAFAGTGDIERPGAAAVAQVSSGGRRAWCEDPTRRLWLLAAALLLSIAGGGTAWRVWPISGVRRLAVCRLSVAMMQIVTSNISPTASLKA